MHELVQNMKTPVDKKKLREHNERLKDAAHEERTEHYRKSKQEFDARIESVRPVSV